MAIAIKQEDNIPLKIKSKDNITVKDGKLIAVSKPTTISFSNIVKENKLQRNMKILDTSYNPAGGTTSYYSEDNNIVTGDITLLSIM